MSAPPPSPPPPPEMTAPPPPAAVPAPGAGRAGVASPWAAVVLYTLRACIPPKRWAGVLLPCAGAVLFGWLATLGDSDVPGEVFANVAQSALFLLVLPITCLIIGDGVLGADVRAGTFQLTWLSPVRFATIVIGRWFGGWLIALVTLLPAFALSAGLAGEPEATGPLVLAAAFGSAAYIALFLLVGVLVRRAAIWSLVIVFLGEHLLASNVTGVGQISPAWQAQQVFAGLWDYGDVILRSGMPEGNSAIVRLVVIAVVCLVLAAWRLARMVPLPHDD